jgi:hypothetical protein
MLAWAGHSARSSVGYRYERREYRSSTVASGVCLRRVAAVATHFRHGDVSNLVTSLGHKAIPHNPNGERARRIAMPRGERLDTGLSLWVSTDVGRHPNAHRLIAT